MIAVQVGRLDDQRVAVFSQDHAVDRCSFANYAHIPGDGERRNTAGKKWIIQSINQHLKVLHLKFHISMIED